MGPSRGPVRRRVAVIDQQAVAGLAIGDIEHLLAIGGPALMGARGNELKPVSILLFGKLLQAHTSSLASEPKGDLGRDGGMRLLKVLAPRRPWMESALAGPS